MSTISSALLNSTASGASTQNSVNATPGTPASIKTSQPASVQQNTTYTPSVANQLASLTYSSAGTLHSAPQTQATAQAAYVAAQNAITQAMGDLLTAPGKSTSSTTDIFGSNTTSTQNDPTGLLGNLSTSSPASNPNATAAQKAYSSAQDAVTQSQGSLIA